MAQASGLKRKRAKGRLGARLRSQVCSPLWGSSPPHALLGYLGNVIYRGKPCQPRQKPRGAVLPSGGGESSIRQPKPLSGQISAVLPRVERASREFGSTNSIPPVMFCLTATRPDKTTGEGQAPSTPRRGRKEHGFNPDRSHAAARSPEAPTGRGRRSPVARPPSCCRQGSAAAHRATPDS